MFKWVKPFKPPPHSSPAARGGGRKRELNGLNVWNSRVRGAKGEKVKRS
jgi:hypothetical protein